MAKISVEEEMFCMYKTGLASEWRSSLYQTFFLSDSFNQSRLMSVFPELVIAWRYSNDIEYWPKLVELWNEKHPNGQLTI